MDLDRAQWEWTLGTFPSRELPELAAQMMVQGFEGPAILELVSFHRPGPQEVPPDLVDRAFLETGRPPLPRRTAVWMLAAPDARALVEGWVPPVEGARRLLRLAPWGEANVEMGAFYQLDELVELWHRDQDPSDRERYERLMIETAWAFLER